MSSAIAYARPRPARGRTPAAAPRIGSWRLPALAVLAFSILAMLACLRFAALDVHPPFPRVAGVVAVGAGLGAALLASGSLPWRAPPATLARLALTLIALYLALRCAGIAGRLLWPGHWGSLSAQLGRGVERLDGLWPYRGHSPDARLAVMACLPAAVIPAAALVFWPGQRAASRRRLAALGLLLALYVVAAANQPRTGWQVQGLVALLALYAWGWSSRGRRAEDGRAAAWLLAGAIVSILAAGALAGGAPLIDVRAWQPFGEPGASTAFNWNQTYGPLPWSTSSAEMVGVSAAAPHLWRATELDRFDGTRFLASAHPPAESRAPALELQHQRWVTRTTFTVHALAGRPLLSPGEILAVHVSGDAAPTPTALAPDGTASAAAALQGGTSYTVKAYVPEPSAAEMRQAPGAVPRGQRAYVRFELPAGRWPARTVSARTAAGRRAIEASPYAAVYSLARRLAAGASDSYEVAGRIEAYLHSGFTYSTRPPLSRYPIVSFLLRERTGYCQQFSAAMALMLRMDGIPARIGSGFLSGTRSGSSYTVRGPDAHAWVEVLFPGVGWVTFDPTPSAQHLAISAGGSGGSALTPAQLTAKRRSRAGHSPVAAVPGTRHGAGESGPSSLLIGALTLVGALAAGAALLSARARRRRGSPTGDGAAAVAELSRALGRLGMGTPPGMTLAALERSLRRSHGEAAVEYVRALREMRYRPADAARPPSPQERRRLRRALTGGRGPLVRLRGMLALPPGRPGG